MTLSDQQLLVGIAMLVAGFASHCSITVYHFSIVFDLAWFSSNTHLASFGVLQVYLAERPSLRTWRVFLMLIILTGIIIATVLQGHWRWSTSANSPAHCLFSDLPGNIKSSSTKRRMAISFTLLLYGYSITIARLYNVIKLCPPSQDKSAKNLPPPHTAVNHHKSFRSLSSEPKAHILSLTLMLAELVSIIGRKLYFAICTLMSSIPALMCLDIV